tara:strand:- start:661 stop:1536 length:876 start_codon:yes stop_codon:yes gene_type:complete
MKNIDIFCFGFGQIAKNFINKIQSENIKISLSATSTKKTSNRIINGLSYKNYFFDTDSFDKDLIERLNKADHILISIPPIDGIDLVLKNFSKILDSSKLKWVTYLSATSVYGDHKGRWVDEKSKTNPTSSNGIARLGAEKSWLSLGINKDFPIQIFRLSGIYSNEQNILTRFKSGDVNLINKQNHFFSRIHVEDAANILFMSMNNFKTGEIYNISDDKPSSSEEVTTFAAKLLNVNIPKKIEINEIKNEMMKNFYKDSKKVCNKKMKFFFNYNLKFPTFVEGLNYIRNNFI